MRESRKCRYPRACVKLPVIACVLHFLRVSVEKVERFSPSFSCAISPAVPTHTHTQRRKICVKNAYIPISRCLFGGPGRFTNVAVSQRVGNVWGLVTELAVCWWGVFKSPSRPERTTGQTPDASGHMSLDVQSKSQGSIGGADLGWPGEGHTSRRRGSLFSGFGDPLVSRPPLRRHGPE